MERAYKNQALKEGAAADAVTFNENSENCYLDPRCEVLWFRPTPFDSLTTSPLPTENLKRFQRSDEWRNQCRRFLSEQIFCQPLYSVI